MKDLEEKQQQKVKKKKKGPMGSCILREWVALFSVLSLCSLGVNGFVPKYSFRKPYATASFQVRQFQYFSYDELEEEREREKEVIVKTAVEEEEEEKLMMETATEAEKVPEVLPEPEVLTEPSGPIRQKIVVLGASGKIGRMVIRRLMEMPGLDATIVAYVRDTSKASWALFRDAVVLPIQGTKGAQLKIVVGNLISPEELPGFVSSTTAAADQMKTMKKDDSNITDKYYGKRVEFVPQGNITDAAMLQDAIQGSTAIISCVGAVRPSNVWSDYLAVPFWRLLRHDVSKWCNDARHPYYVHYSTTRKVLELAEREQKRREAAIEAMDERGDYRKKESIPQRIRFVRISDLCLSKNPWELIPLVTNAFQSIVFRYQDMAERLLEESTHLDTIVLRPGDLTDDERDPDTTSLQISPRGKLNYPAVVGREDIAELAVAASLFPGCDINNATETTDFKDIKPFHMKLAARWVGNVDNCRASQGRKEDGQEDAFLCMRRILKGERRRRVMQRKQGEEKQKESSLITSALADAMEKLKPRRPLKPYGLVVAIPVYICIGLLLQSLFLLPGLNRLGVYLVATSRTLVKTRLPSLWSTLVKNRLPSLWASLLVWLGSFWRKGGVKYVKI